MFFLLSILLSFLFYSPSVRSPSPSHSLFSYPLALHLSLVLLPFLSPYRSSSLLPSSSHEPYTLFSLLKQHPLSLNSSRDSSSISFSNFFSHITPTSYSLSRSLVFFLPTSCPISLFLSSIPQSHLDLLLYHSSLPIFHLILLFRPLLFINFLPWCSSAYSSNIFSADLCVSVLLFACYIFSSLFVTVLFVYFGLTSYSGTTFRVIIKYWHDLFPRSNTGTTFFGGSDTGTTSAFPLRWHFLFFPPPPGCHMVLLILSLSLSSLSSSLFIVSLSSSHAVLLPLSSFSLSLWPVAD